MIKSVCAHHYLVLKGSAKTYIKWKIKQIKFKKKQQSFDEKSYLSVLYFLTLFLKIVNIF